MMIATTVIKPQTTHITEPKPSRTAAARAVLKEKLGGKSSLERGREREILGLDWIYRWGWSSSSALEARVGGTGNSGLARRLIKNGLVVSTKTLTLRCEKYLPAAYLTLTDDGKRVIEAVRDTLLPYDIRPERVDQKMLAHNEMAQRATARNMVRGLITEFASEREMNEKSLKGIKNPDILWIFPSGLKVSVEIELSAKYGQKLDEFVRSTLQSLATKGGEKPRFDQMKIVTNSKAIEKKYMDAFKSETFNTWEKNAYGKFAITGKKTTPAWTMERVSCLFLD